jgi:hypothetical protein
MKLQLPEWTPPIGSVVLWDDGWDNTKYWRTGQVYEAENDHYTIWTAIDGYRQFVFRSKNAIAPLEVGREVNGRYFVPKEWQAHLLLHQIKTRCA